MIRKINLLVWLIIMLAGCSRSIQDRVAWSPEKPKAGDKVKITFRPQRLIETESSDAEIFLVYQLVKERSVATFRIPMAAKKEHYRAQIKTEPGTVLLRLKFEDQTDRVEDNHGSGWNILVRDRRGRVVKNGYRKLGVIFSQENAAGFIPDYNKADSAFSQELLLYPRNYQTWFDRWNTALKKSGWPSQQLNQIKSQLDSLLEHSETDADLLALAFNTHAKLLRDRAGAIKSGEQLLATYRDNPASEEVEYALIFLKHSTDQNTLMDKLIKFSHTAQDEDFLKSVYYQLGLTFQKRQQSDEAIKYFQKYIDLDPADLPIRLNLANLFMRQQNYEMAQQMIDQAGQNNTEQLYFQSYPWEDPQQRRNKLNLNKCQILSTQAALETSLKKYQLAIQNRKRVIELGTVFPAYEWTKIGDLYFQSGKLDSAQQAYLKAVSINTAQEDAIQKLNFLYQLKNKSSVGFEKYLQSEIERVRLESAKPAPEFALTDLNGDLFQLSGQRGKVVVLTFWDSWSTSCRKQIPQLNKLVDDFKTNPDVLFWAISVEAPISINKFIRDNPFKFHLFHSGIEVKKQYHIIGFPSCFIIDPAGKIRYTHIGYAENIQQLLKQEIESILKNQGSIS